MRRPLAPHSWRRDSNERGASEALMLIFMVALIAVAGLAYDTGMAFHAQREAANIASSAARAGANVVDPDIMYESGQARLLGDAVSVATKVVEDGGASVVNVDLQNDDGSGPTKILVQVEQKYQTLFLSFVGIESYTLEAEATALIESRS